MYTIFRNSKHTVPAPYRLAVAALAVALGLTPLCGAQQTIGVDSVPLHNWDVKKAADAAPPTTTAPVSAAAGLVFIPTTPCRAMDTRASSGFPDGFGAPSLTAMTIRKLVMPNSACGLPVAAAYSMRIVSVTAPGVAVGWVNAWSGDVPARPETVVLNAVQGGIVGASTIVAAGADGGIQLEASHPTDIVIDVNGYWLQRASMAYRGQWNVQQSYAAGDVVTSGIGGGGATSVPSSYVASVANTGVDPYHNALTTGSTWTLLTPAGGFGPKGPAGPAGPASAVAGPAGPAGPGSPLIFVFSFDVANPATNFYVPFSGSGDPTAVDKTFVAQAIVMPRACTIKKIYVFAATDSVVSVGLHLWRSIGGVGAPTDTGAFVAAGRGAGNSLTTTTAIAAGDTIAFLVTPGTLNQKTVGTGGVVCQ